MGEREYMDLLELQARIKESVADAFPGRYWVKAEIASWSPRANGIGLKSTGGDGNACSDGLQSCEDGT